MIRTKIKASLLAISLLCASLAAVPALAIETPGDSRKPATEHTVEQAQAAREKAQTATQARLDATKLRACTERQATIHRIMERTVTRAEKQLQLFSSIAERTQAFYTKKGKVLSNYAALVADVNAKKTAAQNVLNELKTTPATFDCNANDPKGIAQSFKEQVHMVNEALKSYKTAVKNLIVGVKSVQGTTSREKSPDGGQQ